MNDFAFVHHTNLREEGNEKLFRHGHVQVSHVTKLQTVEGE